MDKMTETKHASPHCPSQSRCRYHPDDIIHQARSRPPRRMSIHRHADTSRTPSPPDGTMRRRGIHEQRQAQKRRPRGPEKRQTQNRIPVRRYKTNRHALRDERINPPTHKSRIAKPPTTMTTRTIQARQMTMRTTPQRDGRDGQTNTPPPQTAPPRGEHYETHGREDPYETTSKTA